MLRAIPSASLIPMRDTYQLRGALRLLAWAWGLGEIRSSLLQPPLAMFIAQGDEPESALTRCISSWKGKV